VDSLFEGEQPELIGMLVIYLLNNSQESEPNYLNSKSVLLEAFVDRLCLFFQNETSVHRRLQFTTTLLEEMVKQKWKFNNKSWCLERTRQGACQRSSDWEVGNNWWSDQSECIRKSLAHPVDCFKAEILELKNPQILLVRRTFGVSWK
jgi:hypothetical protein